MSLSVVSGFQLDQAVTGEVLLAGSNRVHITNQMQTPEEIGLCL